ncbi:EAL domain-containing protein [Lysobacter sp. TY2-98]|uniref:putative bifunctional diguanylate cyclase/phosphodiesterase n=1 Tax=Lysobacter sp. TY2-98 TaxID=2290922 RepID=UPI000E201E07|nr:EAL domain-containing protein [Lysobacter sp. TY2-98]AXK71527.1 EAL domain-containing protein [Lysobacter sp. TY2-98]
MRFRIGLQAQFFAMVGFAILAASALMVLFWMRQQEVQTTVEGLSRQATDQVLDANLRRRADGTAEQLAKALVNPLYYFDLDAVGDLAKSTLRQPGVRYVLVYDADGNILHDGTADIPTYGRRMDDALAFEAIGARELHAQTTRDILDVSAPILIGGSRLGGVRVGFDRTEGRDFQQAAMTQLRQQIRDLGHRQLLAILLLSAALLALGGVVLALIQRTLVHPIGELADSARAIEAGHFDTGMPVSRRKDELGDLVRAFGRMSYSVARHDREIRRMAYTDALTGLANRLAFREMLDARLMQLNGAGRELALLFADADDFKRINDTLGHDAGDEVLLQFAHRISDTVAEMGGADARVARFGGDEFVILVEDGDVRAGATQLAERLVQVLSEPLVVQGRQVFLGTSVGVTLYPEDADGATALLKNGDIAMYQAKVAGKNCYRFYSRAMNEAVERRVHLENELRGAWDRGELRLVYQPVYRLADQRLVGAEALLRWRHHEQGVIAPSVFIDVAEQSGLIDTIGPQVMRAACGDAVLWEQARAADAEPLFVSVNVSPRQLRSGDLARMVEASLRDAGLSPDQLHIELTETAVISDEAHASQLLTRLRSLGVKVWLDDFGTGFSGLSHLRRVPVDGVKIDRSFVADVLRDPDDLALTTAIIAMAHSLGITVVAEGVEKEGQYALLRERRCDLAQGYWLGHPLEMEEFLALVAEEVVA